MCVHVYPYSPFRKKCPFVCVPMLSLEKSVCVGGGTPTPCLGKVFVCAPALCLEMCFKVYYGLHGIWEGYDQ